MLSRVTWIKLAVKKRCQIKEIILCKITFSTLNNANELYITVGDGDKACEAITSTLLDEIALGLDRSDGVVGNWFKFAIKLNISKKDCQQFEIRVLDDPTCRLFEYIERTKPELTLEEVETVLRSESVNRNNLANLLREVIGREGM